MSDLAADQGLMCIHCGNPALNPVVDMPGSETYVGEPLSDHDWLCGPGTVCYDQRVFEKR